MSENVNKEAEENLLSAMLAGPTAIDNVIGLVEADDFFYMTNGVIYKTIIDMHTRGETVDPITLAAELDRRGQLDKAGGSARVNEVSHLYPIATQAPHYAKIVREQATNRNLAVAGDKIRTLATEPGELSDKLALAEQYLSAAVLRGTGGEVGSITDGLDELVDEWRNAFQNNTPITGKLTGITALDGLLNGFWPGQLIICAARPGVGKSALAQNIAENFADRGERVLFVTLEMSKRELQHRSISRRAKIDSQQLQAGMIPEDKTAALKAAVEALKGKADMLRVDDGGMATIPALVAETTRLHRQGGLGLLVVDYLQLMEGIGKNKAEEVGYISRSLKLLARRLNIPILALSQMNRNILARTDKRPDLSDLRESGSLEQDADVVLFLHRDSDYDPDKADDGSIELIVAKNRRGKLDSANALYTGRYYSFLNVKPVEAKAA